MPDTIQHQWRNGSHGTKHLPTVTVLDNGRILVVSDADTDADGTPDAKEIDATGNPQTSLGKYNGWRGGTDYVDARVIPYFVLPRNWKEVTGIACKLGDVAKIAYKDRWVYAIYADTGGTKTIGEASIAAVEALGHNPWKSGRIKTGIEFGVTYEIIPQSSNLRATVSFETIQAYGRELFEGSAAPSLSQLSSSANWLRLDSPLRGLLFSERPDVHDFFALATGEDAATTFISFFVANYEAVRKEVTGWFVPKYGKSPTHNSCVAHQVSCLKLCRLLYPDWNKKAEVMPSINVDYFVDWALEHDWKKITDMTAMRPGDVCVSGPKYNLKSLDHVYAFLEYDGPENAIVLHNQAFGRSRRSLVGNANTGSWRFALRIPNQ